MNEFRRNLENSFDELGVSYEDIVIQKCLEICNKYDVTDAEEFVDTWMAYSVSHLQGENPTLANLAKFEREEFAKKTKDAIKASNLTQKKSLTIYEANKSMDIDEVSSIIMAYNETTPRRQHSSETYIHESSGIKRSRNYGCSPQVTFSPASFSPTIATPSPNYMNRKNSGSIVCKFNDNEANRSWKSENSYLAKIEIITKSSKKHFMYYRLEDYLDYMNASIEKLGSFICTKYSLDDVMPVKYKHPSPFFTIGKIACDADGRLNSKSVLLEGSTDFSSGASVHLDLTCLEKYSMFPGQIVAIEGYNLTDDKLIVKKIYSDASARAPEPFELPRGCLNIIAAAGPFTPSDSLTYQPLLDLLEEVIKDEPHALILMGPLIDANHLVILENSLAETYEDFLRKLIDKIMERLEKKKTQVIIINSFKDCNAQCVYPTPELSLKIRSYPKLHLLPDPSLFKIEDVLIGVTSTDILMHLSKEEISSSFASGRLSRLAGHILEQRSFYPLCPTTEVPFDPTLSDNIHLDIKPHLLILPSDLRYFITEIEGSIVINPERLAKGVIGGSYVRMILNKNEVVANICKI